MTDDSGGAVRPATAPEAPAGDGLTFTVEELAQQGGMAVAAVLDTVVAGIRDGRIDASGQALRFTSAPARAAVHLELSIRRPATPPEGAPDTGPAATGPTGGAPGGWPQAQELLARSDAEPTRALQWLRATAGRVGTGAPDVAVELLQSALPLARGQGRAELLAELAVSLFAAGRHDEAEAVCRHALATPLPPTERILREALVSSLFGRGRLWAAGREAARAVAALPAGQRSWFVAMRSLPLLFAGRISWAERVATDAQALAEAEGDGRALVLALRTRMLVAQFGVRLAEADRLCAAMVRAAGRSPSPETDPSSLLIGALVQSDLDRPLEALKLIARATGTVRGLGLRADMQSIGGFTGAVHFWAGRWDDALVELTASVEASNDPGWVADSASLLATLQAARGRNRDAAGWAARAEGAARHGRRLFAPARLAWMRGVLCEAAGDGERALSHLRLAWEITERTGLPREQRLIGPLLVGCEPDPEAPLVARVVAALSAQAGANPHVPSLAGTARWVEGLAAGDGERVVEGLELLRTSGRRHAAARCAVDAAVLLSGRPAVATALHSEALVAFDHLKATGDRHRAEQRMRLAGVIAPARTRPSGGIGWAALTPTEQRVAGLVADGLSNPEVAARLFVSPRTVSTHVSHILAKLGVRSRTELAVMVHREVGPGLARPAAAG